VVLLGYLSVFPGWFSHSGWVVLLLLYFCLYFCISHIFVCFRHFLLIFVNMSEVRFDFCAGLYRAPLLVKDSVGEYRLTIGNGLFSSVRRAKGSLVGWMNGELVDAEMYERRCSSGRGGYGIAVKDGLILDCYEEYLRDRCPMSYINSSRGAVLTHPTGGIVPSRNNCEYVLHGYAVSVRTTRVVLPSELLACYGPSYTDYV
jgi:hypothetical protein